MSLETYKIIHLVGIFLLTTGLVAVLTQVWTTGTLTKQNKAFAFSTHGLGLLLILVSGFGMLARLGLAQQMPSWAYVKIAIWVLFAVAISLLKRKGQLGWPLYVACLVLFTYAAYTGIMKP